MVAHRSNKKKHRVNGLIFIKNTLNHKKRNALKKIRNEYNKN